MTNPPVPPSGQHPPMASTPYTQPPYGQPPYGQPPYTQPPYGQPPYTQPPAYNMGYAPPPVPPQKKGLRWWAWLLIIGSGLLVLCCGGGLVIAALSNAASKTTTNSTDGSSNTPSSGPTSVATATPQGAAKVGSTITDNGVACTLVSAKVVSGDQFVQPAAGNEFVLVTVKIVNNSSSEFDYNPLDFNAEWSTVNITHPEFSTPDGVSESQELNDGTLAVGGMVQGQILFQVPKGDHKAKLTWQPGFFSDKTSNAWLLGV